MALRVDKELREAAHAEVAMETTGTTGVVRLGRGGQKHPHGDHLSDEDEDEDGYEYGERDWDLGDAQHGIRKRKHADSTDAGDEEKLSGL